MLNGLSVRLTKLALSHALLFIDFLLDATRAKLIFSIRCLLPIATSRRYFSSNVCALIMWAVLLLLCAVCLGDALFLGFVFVLFDQLAP
jgi:hypothetical protein